MDYLSGSLFFSANLCDKNYIAEVRREKMRFAEDKGLVHRIIFYKILNSLACSQVFHLT